LKIDGFWNKNFRTLLNKIGNAPLPVTSHIKLTFLPQISGNGKRKKQRNCVLIAQIESQISQYQSLHPSLHPKFATHQVLTQIQKEEALHLNILLRYFYSIPDLTEIYDIIRHMISNAAPGPDGLIGAFYKAAWPWDKKMISKKW
jgi:hypothetical protein